MTDRKKSAELIAGEELLAEVVKRMEGKKVTDVAILAAMDAAMAKATIQALIDIMVTRNIVSAEQIGAAIKYHYNRTTDQLRYASSQEGGIVLARPQ